MLYLCLVSFHGHVFIKYKREKNAPGSDEWNSTLALNNGCSKENKDMEIMDAGKMTKREYVIKVKRRERE